MIQRYDYEEYVGYYPRDDGDVVKWDDHEAAVADARKQEREKCIAELLLLHEETMPHGKSFVHVAIQRLSKGLTQ